MTVAEIGDILKRRRELLRMTQADLADMSGVAIKTIHQIENGVGNPSFSTMKKLFDIVGLDIIVDLKKIN